MTETLRIVPISLRAANAYVVEKHRHHGASRGHRFSISVRDEAGTIRGVVIVGRPVARAFDPEKVAEVTRLCTDGTKNACSMLYAAARRACIAMGFEKVITYTLESESGTSLKASGWKATAVVYGRSWSCASRPREDVSPTCPKVRWEA